MAKDLKEMISDGKIKSLVTGESIKTPLDYDTITDRDKEVAETVINRVSELTEQNVPQSIIKEKIVTDLIPVRIRARGQGGKRYSIDILVKDQDKIIFQGLSKNEENDLNDHLTVMLEKGKTFSFETSYDKKSHLVEEELLIDFIIK